MCNRVTMKIWKRAYSFLACPTVFLIHLFTVYSTCGSLGEKNFKGTTFYWHYPLPSGLHELITNVMKLLHYSMRVTHAMFSFPKVLILLSLMMMCFTSFITFPIVYHADLIPRLEKHSWVNWVFDTKSRPH